MERAVSAAEPWSQTDILASAKIRAGCECLGDR